MLPRFGISQRIKVLSNWRYPWYLGRLCAYSILTSMQILSILYFIQFGAVPISWTVRHELPCQNSWPRKAIRMLPRFGIVRLPRAESQRIKVLSNWRYPWYLGRLCAYSILTSMQRKSVCRSRGKLSCKWIDGLSGLQQVGRGSGTNWTLSTPFNILHTRVENPNTSLLLHTGWHLSRAWN
jgi:predicted outer membrane lipoprotein